MKKNPILFGGVAILFISLGILLSNRHTQPPSEMSPVDKLFSLTLPDTNGQTHKLSQWKDKVLIVNFWATWCAPCVDEMPELSSLQTEIASANIQILGIGIDSAGNMAEFARKYKITYPLYVGGVDASELSRQLGNQAGGIPFTVLIGRDGKVRKTYLGRLKMNELRQEIASI